jgi:hypothetical protein
VPNAKDLLDISDLGLPKFLLIGGAGSGKTSQLLTLPGKTFAYFFDPAALSAIRGADIEYEMFVPKVVSLAAQSLTKGKGDTKNLTIVDAAEMYPRWEADFEEKIKTKFFETKGITNIVLDSFTTFADIVMDRVLQINGRAGSWPQQDDWTSQMNTIRNVVRTITGQMNMICICTGHEETIQDELTHRIEHQILLTGKLKQRLPMLFSDIFHMEGSTDAQGKYKYTAQTRPDARNPSLRTSFRGLETVIDVTIGDFKNPKAYGIGALITKHYKL